jgi:hypothetical protein
MAIDREDLREMGTRVSVDAPLRPLDGEEVAKSVALLYAYEAEGWPMPAHAFHLIERLTIKDYAELLFPASSESADLRKIKPHHGDNAEDWSKYYHQLTAVKNQLEADTLASAENKPFIEILTSMIILSEYQLRYLTEQETDEDTFAVYAL